MSAAGAGRRTVYVQPAASRPPEASSGSAEFMAGRKRSQLSRRETDDTDFHRHLKQAALATVALGAQKPPPAAFPDPGSKTSEFHAVKDSKADLHEPKMTDFRQAGKATTGEESEAPMLATCRRRAGYRNHRNPTEFSRPQCVVRRATHPMRVNALAQPKLIALSIP